MTDHDAERPQPAPMGDKNAMIRAIRQEILALRGAGRNTLRDCSLPIRGRPPTDTNTRIGARCLISRLTVYLASANHSAGIRADRLTAPAERS